MGVQFCDHLACMTPGSFDLRWCDAQTQLGMFLHHLMIKLKTTRASHIHSETLLKAKTSWRSKLDLSV